MRESQFSDSSPGEDGRRANHAGLTSTSLEDLERILVGPDAGSCSPEDWEQLRDLAVGRMQHCGLPDEVRVRWGHLALSAVSRKHDRAEATQQATAESARVRAYMIREFGVSDTDTARDLHDLCSDILRNLGIPLEAAAQAAGEWPKMPPDQMLRLRRIKNMLTPLLVLENLLEREEPEGRDLALRDIRSWLELIPKLP
ncbi:hypothetical protein ACIPQA_29400 [Streptomyces sp. NPDC090109]|uniref:hypothetical protein n=1 Tax=unclassified Streptomyces TaxID=2593676 RepID=UPI0013CF11E6|nr:hypothetical protein [Streptomyces sp. S1]